MEWRRLNLDEIARNLDGLREESVADETWERLREEPLTQDATRRLLEGYREVDALLAERIDLFAPGCSERLLELNHLVLCGRTPERREQFASHLSATKDHFYDHPRSGVAGFMDRYGRSRRHAPEVLAAELYVQIVSAPQLFLEGNSRSAALVASYVLARAGMAPLVVTTRALREYHQLVERCVSIDRDGLSGMLGQGIAIRKLTQFLREELEPRMLLAPRAPGAEGQPGRE